MEVVTRARSLHTEAVRHVEMGTGGIVHILLTKKAIASTRKPDAESWLQLPEGNSGGSRLFVCNQTLCDASSGHMAPTTRAGLVHRTFCAVAKWLQVEVLQEFAEVVPFFAHAWARWSARLKLGCLSWKL